MSNIAASTVFTHLRTERDRLAEENAQLRAEVERLRGRELPEGWVAVPTRLTAENGAKSALNGEFAEMLERNCHDCDDQMDDETCPTCDDTGVVFDRVPVSWTTIKAIHARVVELFAAAPKGNEDDE